MINYKEWATPLTIGSFVVTGLMGILIFFHLDIGLIKPAHEWLSWFMVLGAGFHILANWKAFTRHFSKCIGASIIGLFIVLTVLSFIPAGRGGGRERRGGPPFMKAAQSLIDSPLTTVANVAKREPAAVLSALKAQGITVTSEQQTIKAIAEENKKNDVQVLEMIFE